jgi:hypothetical protein
MTTGISASAPPAPFIQTPGTGYTCNIIGANLMTQAMIPFGNLMNSLIKVNAALASLLAQYTNEVNQGIANQITQAQKDAGVYQLLQDIANGSVTTLNTTQQSELGTYNAKVTVIMSQAQAQTQGIQTTQTGATNAIQAFQQAMNEFSTEAGSGVDSSLAQLRIT